MAITAINILASSSSVDASSFVTASFTPSVNTLYILGVINFLGTTATTPTVSGANMTWVQVHTQLRSNNTARVSIFRAMSATPTAGTLTIDFGGTTQNNCGWHLSQFSGTDTTGTNGSGAVIQSNGGEVAANNTSLTITLSTLASSSSAVYGVMREGAPNLINPGSGFTELSEVDVEGAATEAEWSTNDTSVDWSYTNSAGISVGACCEIKVASASSQVYPRKMMLMGVG